MSKTKGWITVACFVAFVVGGFFILKDKTSGAAPTFSIATTTPLKVAEVSPSRDIPVGFKEYKNEQFGFSLLYPEAIPPKEIVDRGPELTVLFQKEGGTEGFQIYVAPIDGGTISEDRFLRDAPSGVRKDPKNTNVAGVPAVQFYGFDAQIGQSAEVWFIGTKEGREVPSFLYEVSTYKDLEP